MLNRHSIKGIAIAGATASGKSALALDLAERLGGVIINADSAQVYADLRVVTARPSVQDEARAPHRLYGTIGGSIAHSAADWARQAAREIGQATRNLPILVGGTGLYFRALFEGLADLPPIPTEIREKWRARAKTVPAAQLHEELAQRDPVMANRLMPNDSQRIIRALEVLEATGRSLADIQASLTQPAVDPADWLRIVLIADRAVLADRIAQRFDAMLSQGALEEVDALLSRRLDPAMPVMKAIGVSELGAHLQGRIGLEDAATQAIAATRRYAKRQETWFRRQMADWQRLDAFSANKIGLRVEFAL